MYERIVRLTRVAMAAAGTMLLIGSAGYAAETAAPLTLEEGLSLVTRENRLVRISTYGAGIAEQDIAVARSRYFPTINASAGYTSLANQPAAKLGGITAPTSERNFGAYGITANEVLYDFGARSASYRAAQESHGIAQSDLTRTRNLVALDFITSFFTLLESEKLVATAEREVEALTSHYETADSLFTAGVITKNDLLQAGVKLSDARQRFVTIRNLRALNAARINTILARPLQAPVIPAEPAGALPEPLALETAWQAAEERRPEIRIIDSELRITGHRETVRRAEFFPTLFAEGGYNYTQNRYQVHPDNWSVTGGLKINLFSGGSTRAELAKLSLRATQLQEQRRKLVEDLRFEVQQYYLEETNARENVITARDAVGQAEENLRINRLRYEAGLGTATDVLDAIALRTLAEKNYCKALYDLRRARAALLYAMGEDLTRRSQ